MANSEILGNTQEPTLPGQDCIDLMVQAPYEDGIYAAAEDLAITIRESDELAPDTLLGILTRIPTHQPEWRHAAYKGCSSGLVAENVAYIVFPAIFKRVAQNAETTESFLALLEPSLAADKSAKLASHAFNVVHWLRQNNSDLSAPALDAIAKKLSSHMPRDYQ